MKIIIFYFRILTYVICLLLITIKTNGQNINEKHTNSYVVDSAVIGGYLFRFGEIRDSKQLAHIVDSCSAAEIKLHGLTSLDFIKYSTKYKDYFQIIFETKSSLTFNREHMTNTNQLLELKGFKIDNLSEIIADLARKNDGYFMILTNCAIHGFGNWSPIRSNSLVLYVNGGKIINPSFKNIHNDLRGLNINNTDLKYIDSPDIYRLGICDLSNNMIEAPPIIPSTIDRMISTIYFSGNPIRSMYFIAANFPESIQDKVIWKGKRSTTIVLE